MKKMRHEMLDRARICCAIATSRAPLCKARQFAGSISPGHCLSTVLSTGKSTPGRSRFGCGRSRSGTGSSRDAFSPCTGGSSTSGAWTIGIATLGEFLSDIEAIRKRAREHMSSGAVTQSYKGDREKVVKVLNEVLATELVCALRYKRHYYMAEGF